MLAPVLARWQGTPLGASEHVLTSDDKTIPTYLEDRNHLAIFAWGAIVAPITIGLALGVAVVTGGEVPFGVFSFPPTANVELAILFVLALIAVLLAGILHVLSARRS